MESRHVSHCPFLPVVQEKRERELHMKLKEALTILGLPVTLPLSMEKAREAFKRQMQACHPYIDEKLVMLNRAFVLVHEGHKMEGDLDFESVKDDGGKENNNEDEFKVNDFMRQVFHDVFGPADTSLSDSSSNERVETKVDSEKSAVQINSRISSVDQSSGKYTPTDEELLSEILRIRAGNKEGVLSAKRISQLIKEQRSNTNCNAKRVQSIISQYEKGLLTVGKLVQEHGDDTQGLVGSQLPSPVHDQKASPNDTISLVKNPTSAESKVIDESEESTDDEMPVLVDENELPRVQAKREQIRENTPPVPSEVSLHGPTNATILAEVMQIRNSYAPATKENVSDILFAYRPDWKKNVSVDRIGAILAQYDAMKSIQEDDHIKEKASDDSEGKEVDWRSDGEEFSDEDDDILLAAVRDSENEKKAENTKELEKAGETKSTAATKASPTLDVNSSNQKVPASSATVSDDTDDEMPPMVNENAPSVKKSIKSAGRTPQVAPTKLPSTDNSVKDDAVGPTDRELLSDILRVRVLNPLITVKEIQTKLYENKPCWEPNVDVSRIERIMHQYDNTSTAGVKQEDDKKTILQNDKSIKQQPGKTVENEDEDDFDDMPALVSDIEEAPLGIDEPQTTTNSRPTKVKGQPTMTKDAGKVIGDPVVDGSNCREPTKPSSLGSGDPTDKEILSDVLRMRVLNPLIKIDEIEAALHRTKPSWKESVNMARIFRVLHQYDSSQTAGVKQEDDKKISLKQDLGPAPLGAQRSEPPTEEGVDDDDDMPPLVSDDAVPAAKKVKVVDELPKASSRYKSDDNSNSTSKPEKAKGNNPSDREVLAEILRLRVANPYITENEIHACLKEYKPAWDAHIPIARITSIIRNYDSGKVNGDKKKDETTSKTSYKKGKSNGDSKAKKKTVSEDSDDDLPPLVSDDEDGGKTGDVSGKPKISTAHVSNEERKKQEREREQERLRKIAEEKDRVRNQQKIERDRLKAEQEKQLREKEEERKRAEAKLIEEEEAAEKRKLEKKRVAKEKEEERKRAEKIRVQKEKEKEEERKKEQERLRVEKDREAERVRQEQKKAKLTEELTEEVKYLKTHVQDLMIRLEKSEMEKSQQISALLDNAEEEKRVLVNSSKDLSTNCDVLKQEVIRLRQLIAESDNREGRLREEIQTLQGRLAKSEEERLKAVALAKREKDTDALVKVKAQAVDALMKLEKLSKEHAEQAHLIEDQKKLIRNLKSSAMSEGALELPKDLHKEELERLKAEHDRSILLTHHMFQAKIADLESKIEALSVPSGKSASFGGFSNTSTPTVIGANLGGGNNLISSASLGDLSLRFDDALFKAAIGDERKGTWDSIMYPFTSSTSLLAPSSPGSARDISTPTFPLDFSSTFGGPFGEPESWVDEVEGTSSKDESKTNKARKDKPHRKKVACPFLPMGTCRYSSDHGRYTHT